MKKIIIMYAVMGVVLSSCALQKSKNIQAESSANTVKEETLTVEEKVKKAIAFRLGTKGVEKNEAKSFLLFKDSAIQGNMEAQKNLAWMYQMGIGVEKNKPLAIQWYMKSSHQGSVLSKYNLGYIYLFDRNYIEALHWFKEASGQGFIPAWNELGSMYSQGWGVDKNPEIAVQYFKRAAENGDNNGQINLGMLYYEGVNVPKNDVQAYAWLNVARCAFGGGVTCFDQVQNLTERMSRKKLKRAEVFAMRIANTIATNTKNHVCHVDSC